MSAYSRWGSGSEGAEAVFLLWFVRYKAHWVSHRRIVISYHITLARCTRRRAAYDSDSTYLTADILAQYILIISNYIVESCWSQIMSFIVLFISIYFTC